VIKELQNYNQNVQREYPQDRLELDTEIK